MIYRLLCVLLMILLAAPSSANAQAVGELQPLAMGIDFPNVTIDFQVLDSAGHSVVGLKPGNIQLSEDGKPVAQFTLREHTANAATPGLAVTLSDGMVHNLAAKGATIGIVFDATQLLNGTGSNAANHLEAARLAIEAFLLEPGDPQAPPIRSMSPNSPERVGLFIPVDNAVQSLQPADLPGFTQDRYEVINALRNLQPRSGKTNLYAAVQAAIEATASESERTGTTAVVLVVSDGGDAISGDTFNAVIDQANDRNVQVATFGIGTDNALEAGGFRLKQLADGTGGMYAQRPDATAAGTVFTQLATPTATSIYTLNYQTAIIDDGKEHQIQIVVNLPDGGSVSNVIPFAPSVAFGVEPVSLNPLGDVLLRQYFLIALPAALLLSLLLTIMTGAVVWRERGSSGIKNRKTRR